MKQLIWLAIFWISPLTAGWLDRKAEGWAWYEDKEIKEKNQEVETPLPFTPAKLSPLEELAQVKKEMEEKLAAAVLNPNQANVTEYMRLQKQWIDQSGQFAKMWSHILLQQPILDETATGFPVSQYGIQLQKQLIQEQKESLMKELVKDHGLFFFYEGKQKASIVFSTVVQHFAKRYGWHVIAISTDGIFIEGFTENKQDNGIAKKLGVTVFPSLFVVNPQSQVVLPISFGLTSLDQIESNITMQFKE